MKPYQSTIEQSGKYIAMQSYNETAFLLSKYQCKPEDLTRLGFTAPLNNEMFATAVNAVAFMFDVDPATVLADMRVAAVTEYNRLVSEFSP